MTNSIRILGIFLLGIFAVTKNVGFDPDSIHYYSWIISGIYSELAIEPIFKIQNSGNL